ncbi:DUF6776 family protein [Idiomarina sp.]|uniref:DUF6776 family protein n=1 Tax=Idiomarina sp. TaxID=1874361 RepID=UPI003513AB5D
MKLGNLLKRLKQRVGALAFYLGAILLLCVSIYFAYWVGGQSAEVKDKTLAQQDERLDQLYQQIEALEYQTNVLSVELDIERSANEELQAELSELQNDNYALRRDVAFYQKIMAPELEQGGVVIESFALTPNANKRHFHFSLALLQIEQRRQFVEGHITIELQARTGEKTVKRYNLLELANIEPHPHHFSMRYFSLLEGDFILPEGVLPEHVDVRVTLTEGGRGQLERRFYWTQSLRQNRSLELEANQDS